MKLKHFSIIITIVGLILLYFLTTLSKPTVIELHDISEYEGKKITTTGYIKKYYKTGFENQIIKITKNNSEVTIFSEEVINIEYGDLIKVTGQVQKYNDEWEIIVENKKDIILLKKWKNISFPLWQLSENPERYIGINVNTTGYIDNVYDSYFYLTDLEQKQKIIISYNKYQKSFIIPGQKINVNGLFLFDKNNFCYKIDVKNKEQGIILKMER